MKLLEADIQHTCTQYLALDGWRALRTDPVSDRRRGKGFGEVGMADHLYIRYLQHGYPPDLAHGLHQLAEVMWIEWKRLDRFSKREHYWLPTKAGEHQRNWHKAESARGAFTLIAGEDFPATIEGFLEWYGKSGLCRMRETARRINEFDPRDLMRRVAR